MPPVLARAAATITACFGLFLGWQQFGPSSHFQAAALISVPDADRALAADTVAGVLGSRALVAAALKQAGAPRVDAAAIDATVASVRVAPIGETRLLRIAVQAPSPVQAAAVANALASQYVDYADGRRRAHVEAALTQATAAHEARAAALARAEAALRGAGASGVPAATLVASAHRLRAQLATARGDRRLLDAARWQIANAARPLDAPAVAGETLVQELRAQQVHLQQRRAELTLRYGTLHPLVMRAEADATALEAKIERAATMAVAAFNRDHAAAAHAEQALEAELAAVERELAAIERDAAIVETLAMRVDQEREAEARFAANVRTLREQQATATAEVQLVEHALPASSPAGTRTPAAMAVVASGICVMAPALVRRRRLVA